MFRHNTAGRGGGAADIATPSAVFVNAEFEDNTAHTGGGAVFLTDSALPTHDTANFTHCRFESNRVYQGNDAMGGAVVVSGVRSVTITACEFRSNAAESGRGGALCILGPAPNSSPSVVFDGSTLFLNNTACQGGAVYCGGLYSGVDRALLQAVSFSIPSETASVWFQGNTAIECDESGTAQWNAGGAVYWQYGGPDRSALLPPQYVDAGENRSPKGFGDVFGTGNSQHAHTPRHRIPHTLF
jgi:predicted outer membrane repeat protein